MNCSTVSLVSFERLQTRKLNELPELVPIMIKVLSDSSIAVSVISVLAALFLATIIVLIMAILFYFVPRKREFLVKDKSVPNVAVTIQDKKFTLKETNPLATDVKEGAYEDITTDQHVSLAHTEVQSQIPLYVNVAESTFPHPKK